MKNLIESGWPLGWIPSAAEKGDPTGQSPLGLLRMDNLTMDELGILRIARSPRVEALTQFPNNDIFSIFSTTINNQKVRFVYVSSGATARSILCTTIGDPRHFNITLITQAETTRRCEFLNVLGQIFMVAGSIKRKYDGVNNFPIGIPAPAPPTLTGNATNFVNLSNLPITGFYTNWTSVSSGSFNNSGAEISGTATPTPSSIADIFSFETTYATPIDTTNLGGAGNDTPNDRFEFLLNIDDATQLVFVKITLFCAVTPNPQNYFWKEWDFNRVGLSPDNPYFPFNISSGITTPVPLDRSQFFRVGDDATKGWDDIKAVRVEIGLIKASTATVTWKTFKVSGGTKSTLTGNFNYVAVLVRDTGDFLEFSPASTPVSIDATVGNITVTPAAGAVDAQANQYWLFRQDVNGGAYFRIASQSGAAGFTPVPFLDFRLLDDIIGDANVNSLYVLKPFRAALPNNIIGMIWFRDRVIYLAKDGFIPSFQLDPGSYDSRFKYEIIGTSSENALFIAKLDVGTFIIATTKDFYRITGTFAVQIDPNDPTGQVQFQDVVITPLGISDPAISHAFVEYQGALLYVSATGVRLLVNGTSTLINDNLDLLFRNESRYEVPPIQLLPCDQSLISMATSGTRIYISMPHRDAIYRTYVLNIANQSNAFQTNTRSWRLLTMGDNKLNPISMCKEEDGTIIFGAQADPLNYIKSLETDTLDNLPVTIRTQFNYGGSRNRKDALGLKLKVNTGGNVANLVVRGLMYDGSIDSTTIQFFSVGDAILELDIKEQLIGNILMGLKPAIAYAFEIGCLTNIFKLEWLELTYEERPAGVRRVIVFSGPLDKSGRKRIGSWAFVADPLGLLSNSPTNITALMKIDDEVQPPQVFTGKPGGRLFQWNCNPFKDILAYNWELELIGDEEFEFYKFLPPDITQETPGLSNQVIFPASNFGKPNLKKISVWPFIANSFNRPMYVKVRIDQVEQDIQIIKSNDIRTLFWKNNQDVAGTDWEMEIICPDGMEFYKFLAPDILQIFPIGRIIDQIGPLDFNAQGMVYAIRFRIMSAGIVHYKVYDADSLVFEDDLTASMGDQAYIIKIPKGIHPAVCRLVLSADQLFYRFSVEYNVRLTGKDSEGKFIMVPDRSA